MLVCLMLEIFVLKYMKDFTFRWKRVKLKYENNYLLKMVLFPLVFFYELGFLVL